MTIKVGYCLPKSNHISNFPLYIGSLNLTTILFPKKPVNHSDGKIRVIPDVSW